VQLWYGLASAGYVFIQVPSLSYASLCYLSTTHSGTEEGFTDDPTVFYGSSHGKDHYPGTGHDPSPFIGERAQNEVDRRIVNRLLTPGPESRPEFFVKWREILDEMERFQPQLVIMSTGARLSHFVSICILSATSLFARLFLLPDCAQA
jgi:hypothetical protein